MTDLATMMMVRKILIFDFIFQNGQSKKESILDSFSLKNYNTLSTPTQDFFVS